MILQPYMYSKINPNRWSFNERMKRKTFYCEHRHNGIRHAACYNKKFSIEERKGAVDIEAGGLDADFDIMLSWAIKTVGQEEYWYDNITTKDINNGEYDKRIVESLVDTLWNYDRIITHYGNNGRFDIPFIRARYLWLKARDMYEGKPFPWYGMMWQSDVYSFARQKLKIASRRQGSVANVLQGKDIKTRIEKNYWLGVKYGEPKIKRNAVKYIIEHNLKDVEQLEGNYLTLLPFVREVHTSI